MHDILVTGGAGFVGSNVAIAFKSSFPTANVTVLDNLKRRGSELNLARLRAHGIQFLHGDIRSPEDFTGLQPDLIIECSAEPSAQAGYDGSPEYLIRTNLVGTFHCLELARKTGAAFLFLSTSRVYPVSALNCLKFAEDATRFRWLDSQESRGASSQGVNEDFPLDGARSLYGMTKLASELMIEEYVDAYGLKAVINRCGLISGPWQMGKTDQGVISLWVAAHYFGGSLRYIGFGGSGKQVRDILHIDDVTELLVAQARDLKQYSGKKFNVGGGLENSLSLLELTELCSEVTGKSITVASSSEDRPADLRIYLTDQSKLTALSGWSPSRDPRKVVSDLFAWIEHNEDRVRPILCP